MNMPEDRRVSLSEIPPDRIAIEVTNMYDDEPRFVAGETLEEDAERERIGKLWGMQHRDIGTDVGTYVFYGIVLIALGILVSLAIVVVARTLL